jgi:hypothetical protein
LFKKYNIKCAKMSINDTLEFYGNKFKINNSNATVCFPTTGQYSGTIKVINGTDKFFGYYLPEYKIVFFSIPFDELDSSIIPYIIYYIFDFYYLPYYQKSYMKYMTYTVYGKLDEKLGVYIGEQEYKHYYTRNVLSKIEVDYLVPKNK